MMMAWRIIPMGVQIAQNCPHDPPFGFPYRLVVLHTNQADSALELDWRPWGAPGEAPREALGEISRLVSGASETVNFISTRFPVSEPCAVLLVLMTT